MYAVLRRPPVHQQAQVADDDAREHEWDAELRLAGIAVSRLSPSVQEVHQGSAQLGASNLRQRDRDVVQAADLDGLVVLLDPEVGEGGEDNIQQAVVEARDDCRDLNDGVEG